MANEQDVWELIVKTIGADKVKEMTDILEGLNEEADKLEPITTKAAKGSSNMGRATLEASRALEDLQYGIGGVLNNLPGLVSALGGPAGLAGLISIVAVGALQLYNNWDKLMNLFEEKQALPKAGTDVAALKRELEGAKDQMEKMEKAGTATLAELEKYNTLRARTAEIEKTIADEQERQALLKKIMEAPSEEAEGRAKGFMEAIKGKGGATQETIATAIAQTAQEELAAAFDARTLSVQTIKAKNLGAKEELAAIESTNAVYKMQKKNIEERIADADKDAQEMMLKLAVGDEEAFHSLDVLIKGTGNLFGDLATKMAEANPVLKKKADEAAKANEEAVKIWEEAADAEEKAAEEKKKQADKDVEFWNKAGAEFEAEQEKAAKARLKDKEFQQKAGIKGFVEQETRTIKAGGFAEQTEAMLAQGRAQGGFAGRRMTPDQQFEFVRRQAEQQFRGQFPGMGAQQRGDMAMRVTAMGQKNLNQRMADLQAREFNAVDATQMAVAETLQAVQALANKVQGQIAVANGLQRGARQMHNAAKQLQPGAGNVGGN